jgi:non-specific serine/threonine protein kinase
LVQANIEFGEASGNLGLVARSLHALGIINAFAGDWEQSDRSFFAALAIARQIDDQPTIARVLNHLGGLSRMRGEDDSAHAFYTESLAIWRRIGVPERIAMVLHNMAPVLSRQGREADAHVLIGESLRISHELRNVHGVALCLMAIAGMTRRAGTQAVMAAQLLGAANALRSSIGVQWDPDDQAEQARSTENVARLLDADALNAAVAQGRAISLDEAVAQARQLLKAMAVAGSPRESIPAPRPLTKREQEIAYQVSLGRTNRDIARLLSISEKTVEMHIGHSLSKLEFRSRAQLAAWIIETSVSPVPDA